MTTRPSPTVLGDADAAVDAIRHALAAYMADHPGSDVELYRADEFDVRIKIVDPGFQGMRRILRHEGVWKYLGSLPAEAAIQAMTVAKIAPGEPPPVAAERYAERRPRTEPPAPATAPLGQGAAAPPAFAGEAGPILAAPSTP